MRRSAQLDCSERMHGFGVMCEIEKKKWSKMCLHLSGVCECVCMCGEREIKGEEVFVCVRRRELVVC